MIKKASMEELKPFLNGVTISEGDTFTIDDLIAIANNMKRIDIDYYNHCFLGIVHDETNGDPLLMEFLFNKAISDGIIGD